MGWESGCGCQTSRIIRVFSIVLWSLSALANCFESIFDVELIIVEFRSKTSPLFILLAENSASFFDSTLLWINGTAEVVCMIECDLWSILLVWNIVWLILAFGLVLIIIFFGLHTLIPAILVSFFIYICPTILHAESWLALVHFQSKIVGSPIWIWDLTFWFFIFKHPLT